MIVKQLLTAEQLGAMPEVSGKRFELVRGEIIEIPGAGGLHGHLVTVFLFVLHPFVVAHKLGKVFADGVGYIIARQPDIVRIPDVSFVSWTRLPKGAIPEGFIACAPDLAIEIVSPGDRAEEVYAKVHEYLDAGTRLVWVVWPRHHSITVYTPDHMARELREGDELDGNDVLPGFRALVAELFQDL